MHWGTPSGELSDVKARWIIGADGHASRVRKWAGLDRWRRVRERLGFRVHYRMAPWTDHVEVHWHPEFQMYVAAVAADEVMVACYATIRKCASKKRWIISLTFANGSATQPAPPWNAAEFPQRGDCGW